MDLYLDHNATSPLDRRVREVLITELDRNWANPNSLHAAGRRARARLEDARERLAAAVDVAPTQVVFVSGGTEANNLAVHNLCSRLDADGRLCSSPLEHPSVAEPVRRAGEVRSELGPSWLTVEPSGQVSHKLPQLPAKSHLSLVLAQSEVGVVQPVAELAEQVHGSGGLVHSDMVQALGRHPLRAALAACDLATLSVHKSGGPRGIGVLLAAKTLELEPMLLGGGQEHGRRAGTEAVALALAAAKSIELSVAELDDRAARMRAARDRLQTSLAVLDGVHLLGTQAPRLPNTLAACFLGLDGRSLLLALDLAGVHASLGSACASRSARPSQALLSMGLSEERARATVRFSFGNDATPQQAERAAEVIERVVNRLRRTGQMGD